jgi:hypothetical protein
MESFADLLADLDRLQVERMGHVAADRVEGVEGDDQTVVEGVVRALPVGAGLRPEPDLENSRDGRELLDRGLELANVIEAG